MGESGTIDRKTLLIRPRPFMYGDMEALIAIVRPDNLGHLALVPGIHRFGGSPS